MDDYVINRADEFGRSIYLRDRPPGTRSVIFTGEPGMGKSFMLDHAAAQARANGHLVIRIDASSRESLQTRMTRSIDDQLDQLKDRTPFRARHLLRKLRRTLDTMLTNRFGIQNAISASLSTWAPLRIGFSHGHDQQFERPTSSISDLADRLGELAGARDQQAILLIDNLEQASESDLVAINELARHLEQGEQPVNLAMAASPPAVDRLLIAATPDGPTADSVRCYDVRTCAPVPDAELRPALTARIARTGGALDPSAADLLLAEAAGHPGRLSRLADQAARLADPRGVSAETARTAIEQLRQADSWVHRAGWNNLTPRAKAVLADAAAAPDGLRVADLDAGVDADEWAERDAARAELVGAGLVREDGGRLRVPDPGLRQWVVDHTAGRAVLTGPSTDGTAPSATGKDATTDRPVAQETNSTTSKEPTAQATAKRTTGEKATTQRPTTTKTAAKKATAKKTTAEKTTANKSAAKNGAAKKTAAQKTAAQKAALGKTGAKKAGPAKHTRLPDLPADQPPAVHRLAIRRTATRPGQRAERAS